MSAHLNPIDGEFQSDKFPSVPKGLVPLSVRDTDAQDLLWEYAQRHRQRDTEFSDDLETALINAGYVPPSKTEAIATQVASDAAKGALDVADSMVRGGRRLFDRLQKRLQDGGRGPGGSGPTPA